MRVLMALFCLAMAAPALALQTTPVNLRGTWKGACMAMGVASDNGGLECGKKWTWMYEVTYTTNDVNFTLSGVKGTPSWLPAKSQVGSYTIQRRSVAAKFATTFPNGLTQKYFAITKQIGPVRNNVFQYVEDGIIDLGSGQSRPAPNKNGADLYCSEEKGFNYRCTALRVSIP